MRVQIEHRNNTKPPFARIIGFRDYGFRLKRFGFILYSTKIFSRHVKMCSGVGAAGGGGPMKEHVVVLCEGCLSGWGEAHMMMQRDVCSYNRISAQKQSVIMHFRLVHIGVELAEVPHPCRSLSW